jgi:hypothetical protein
MYENTMAEYLSHRGIDREKFYRYLIYPYSNYQLTMTMSGAGIGNVNVARSSSLASAN